MRNPQTVIGYEFYPHGRGEITFLNLSVHVYEVNNALTAYQESLARGRSDTDYLRQKFERVESRRGALSTPWGKPGMYLARPSFDEQHVEFKWQASQRIEYWYGGRVEMLALSEGSVGLFEKLVRQIRKTAKLSPSTDKPSPNEVVTALKELNAITPVLCEFNTSGHFWLPAPEPPVPECPFKAVVEAV